MEYYEIYLKRLNRYGTNHQARIQAKREKEFHDYLAKSVYRVEFEHNEQTIIGSFEKYRQDETKTLQYLLVDVNINFDAGTILFIPDKDNVARPWMVYWLEDIKASGYNRYTMLRMTHFLTWRAPDADPQTSWAYMYGQEDNMLKDELKSRSRMDTLYNENLKASFFIMPRNQFIQKDVYFVIGEKPYQEYFRVTGFDRQSTIGVEYVTIDPVYEYDLTPAPVPMPGDDDPTDFYWLNENLVEGVRLYDNQNYVLEDIQEHQLLGG